MSVSGIGGGASLDLILATLRMAVAQQQAVVAMVAQAGQTSTDPTASAANLGATVDIVV